MARTRALDWAERLGNRLPHPFWLFVYLALSVAALSTLMAWRDVAVTHPSSGELVEVRGILSFEGVRYVLQSMLTNFTGFAPLGTVLVLMLGIGLADKVGLIQTLMKRLILRAPRRLIAYAVVFTGILGNLASDAAYVLVPPLAAIVFLSVGRHPLAGIAAGLAGVGSGFTANFFIAGTDALLSGITTEAVRAVDPQLEVTPVDNWFFMCASVVLLTLLGGLITEHLVEPRLGKYLGAQRATLEEASSIEVRGLRRSGVTALILVALVVVAVLPAGSPLRNDEGGLVPSPFLRGIVPLLFVFFTLVAAVYGKTVGTIASLSDIPDLMAAAVARMSAYIVLVFAAAQFIAWFRWTNTSTWLAVEGSEGLSRLGFTGLPLILGFVVLAAILNLAITSGSAQWAVMAPIFVPMLMLLDYHPAFVQLAFRIADSSTNTITPMNTFLLLVLGYVKEYRKDAGMGTLLALMLPYALIFLFLWMILLGAWYASGLPIGPGVVP